MKLNLTLNCCFSRKFREIVEVAERSIRVDVNQVKGLFVVSVVVMRDM